MGEVERELAVVIAEEKAKVVLGNGYFTLVYSDWVEGLKSFVQTQLCADCGSLYDVEEPEEQMWGWFVEPDGEIEAKLEELEVAEFYCNACDDQIQEEIEASHPISFGTLLFRRPPTGTFPFDDEDQIFLTESTDIESEDPPNENN